MNCKSIGKMVECLLLTTSQYNNTFVKLINGLNDGQIIEIKGNFCLLFYCIIFKNMLMEKILKEKQ